MLKFYSFALYMHFLQNTSWIYTVPSIPCCLWLTGFFIGPMIISTVQFLWLHRYLVVIKYMSFVAVYIGIWMINCDNLSIWLEMYTVQQFCVYDINGGKGRLMYTEDLCHASLLIIIFFTWLYTRTMMQKIM